MPIRILGWVKERSALEQQFPCVTQPGDGCPTPGTFLLRFPLPSAQAQRIPISQSQPSAALGGEPELGAEVGPKLI